MEENTRNILSSFIFGDMLINYLIDKDEHVTLEMLPLGMEDRVIRDGKTYRPDSLIQCKLVGDAYPGANAGGMSMMNSGTVNDMHYDAQGVTKNGNMTIVSTTLKDRKNHRFVHNLSYTEGDYALECYTEFYNDSDSQSKIEYITSFAIGNMTPFIEGSAVGSMDVCRIRSKWSHEGRLVKESLEELQLEPSWVKWHPLSVRFGQRGSMPVKEYAPFAAVEDKITGVTWGAALKIECSWQMEFYRRDDALVFAGGLADREFGHFLKNVEPGESFETPHSIITVGCGDVDCISQRITRFCDKYLENVPECEKELPVLFNEYCTTWGLPSHKNIMNTVNALKGHDVKYFVIDCGWFVEEGKPWGDGMGDYIPSDILFPKGLKYTVDCIREAGFKPGIWYEIDNAGHDSHIYYDESYFLHKDGIPITTEGRRFFNMKDPKVIAYLDEKVIDQIKKYGFEYVKMDYNDTIGIGSDEAESLGEGLRQDREASVNYVKRLLSNVPGLVLENCSSGGHKTEPLMMSLCAMASFSDAHECEHIPLIAAGLHRTILPRQSQIWAVIRKDDSVKRIAWTIINTYLGRMCFSGDVCELTDTQWAKIDEGIAFYHKISPIVKDGYSYIYRNTGDSETELSGYQVVIRVQNDGKELIPAMAKRAYAVISCFTPSTISVPLPSNCPRNILESYSGTSIKAHIEGDNLVISPTEGMEALALIFG